MNSFHASRGLRPSSLEDLHIVDFHGFEEDGSFMSIETYSEYDLLSHSFPLRPEASLSHHQNGSILSSFLSSLGQTLAHCGFASSSSRLLAPQIPSLFASSDNGIQSLYNCVFGSSQHYSRGLHGLWIGNRQYECRPRVVGILQQESTQSDRLGSRLKHIIAETIHSSTAKLSKSAYEEFKCPICLDIFHKPVYTPCHHVLCLECIVISLLQQSLCPLCRAPVYSQSLKGLEDAVQIPKLGQLYQRYSRLVVECPKCRWIGSMANWSKHLGSPECAIRQRHGAETSHSISKQPLVSSRRRLTCPKPANSSSFELPPPSSSFPPSPSTPFSCPSHYAEGASTTASGSRQESLQPSLLLDQLVSPVDALGRVHAESISEASDQLNATDRLIAWISETRLDRITKVYVVSHKMENMLGALAGEFTDVFQHSQAIVEAKPLPQCPDRICNNVFISLELFVHEPHGLCWEAFNTFPRLKSTAQQISVYHCESESPSENSNISAFVHFLAERRNRQYDLFTWNCKTLTLDLLQVLKVTQPPTTTFAIPKPSSYSPYLMTFLDKLNRDGAIPILSSPQVQTASPSPPNHPLSWKNKFLGPRFLCSSRAPQIRDKPVPRLRPALRVRNIHVCYFPAEDLHRASLWPMATWNRLWGTETTLARPNVNQRAAPIAGQATGPAINCPIAKKPTTNQIKFKFNTLPVLLLNIQSRDDTASTFHEIWDTVCYLSIEFRSDNGLWWHVYRELPPGLYKSTEAGGTNYVVSTEVNFTVSQLIDTLAALEHKQYHPTIWSGWEFCEFIVMQCCPSVAHHLLRIPDIPV